MDNAGGKFKQGHRVEGSPEEGKAISHVSTIKTQIKDFDVFRKVLEEMGAELEVGENLQYETPWNRGKVDMIVNPKGARRKGFMGAKIEEDGTYEIVGDDYGSGMRLDQFATDVNRQYSKQKVLKEFAADPELSQFSYTEETNAVGEIVLKFERF